MSELMKIGNSWIDPKLVELVEPFHKGKKICIVVHTSACSIELPVDPNDAPYLQVAVDALAAEINSRRTC